MRLQSSSGTGARLRNVAVLIALIGGLLATSLSTVPASAASEAHKLAGSEKCQYGKIKRCVWLEAYWIGGKRKVRAATGEWTYDDYLVLVSHVSLYRNSTRVTTARGNSGQYIDDRLATHGSHRKGEYHVLARLCWKRRDTHHNYRCVWLEGPHKMFRP